LYRVQLARVNGRSIAGKGRLLTPWDDPAELIKGLRSRNDSAWNYFIEHYGRLIYAVAGKLGLKPAEQEDLFQEACMTILRAIHTLRDPSKLSSWIYSVSRRLAINAHRGRKSTVQIDILEERSSLDDETDLEPGFAREFETLELSARVWDAVGDMEPRCRQLLRWLYLADPPLSYAEISKRAGTPIGSIGPTRARCLDKLRKRVFPLSRPGGNASA